MFVRRGRQNQQQLIFLAMCKFDIREYKTFKTPADKDWL